jgi:hypothetical protein
LLPPLICGVEREWDVFRLSPFAVEPCPRRYPRGRKNHCENDSLRLAQEHPELRLVAGYIPQRWYWQGSLVREVWWGHFWCADPGGYVIDTSPAVYDGEEAHEAYVGFFVSTAEATRAAASTRKWGTKYVKRSVPEANTLSRALSIFVGSNPPSHGHWSARELSVLDHLMTWRSRRTSGVARTAM